MLTLVMEHYKFNQIFILVSDFFFLLSMKSGIKSTLNLFTFGIYVKYPVFDVMLSKRPQ